MSCSLLSRDLPRTSWDGTFLLENLVEQNTNQHGTENGLAPANHSQTQPSMLYHWIHNISLLFKILKKVTQLYWLYFSLGVITFTKFLTDEMWRQLLFPSSLHWEENRTRNSWEAALDQQNGAKIVIESNLIFFPIGQKMVLRKLGVACCSKILTVSSS